MGNGLKLVLGAPHSQCPTTETTSECKSDSQRSQDVGGVILHYCEGDQADSERGPERERKRGSGQMLGLGQEREAAVGTRMTAEKYPWDNMPTHSNCP